MDARDGAYERFLDHVGTPACRDAITAVQRRVLGADRRWFLDRTHQQAGDQTWRVVGGLDTGFEAAVVEASFAFWQYGRRDDCADVPRADASRPAVWDWLEQVSPLTSFTDRALRPYVPYYHQALGQLGSPMPYERRLADLLRHPGTDVPATFVPDRLEPVRHDPAAMPDVDRWVRSRGERLVFLYGGDDPWTAEPFRRGRGAGARQCHRYVVPGGDHGVGVADLPRAERVALVRRLARWVGA